MNYLTVPESAKACGMTLNTAYRVAKRLGIVEVMYGRYLIPKAKIAEMKSAKRGKGNPRWAEEPGMAAAAGKKGGTNKARNRR